MNDKALRSLVVTIGVILALAWCEGVSVEKAPPPKAKEWKSIPLNVIYSTNGQKGLKEVGRGGKESYDQVYALLRRDYNFSGASNILLVRGDDFATVMKSTRRAFTSAASAETPVGPNEPGKSPGSLWLVAYLGVTGSSPPAFLVNGAERKGNVFRVSFSVPGAETQNMHHYFVWVPLGKLEAGTYSLELFNADRKEVTLTRCVWVEASK